MKSIFSEIKRVFIHIRWPFQSYVVLGFLFGIVISRIDFSWGLVLGFISWFLICAGAVVFNGYYDRDNYPVVGLEKPPSVTVSMLYGSLVLKFIGLIIALFLNNLIFLAIYIAAIFASVIYSHRSFRFKSKGYIALLFNFAIGAMTFTVASSFSMPSALILTLGIFSSGFFIVSIYLMTQVHQTREDQLRGDISIAVLYGKKTTLQISLVLMVIASVMVLTLLKLSSLPIFYIFLFSAYFLAIFLMSYVWLNKKDDSALDFRTMNKLTLRASYSANFILMIIYILEINGLN